MPQSEPIDVILAALASPVRRQIVTRLAVEGRQPVNALAAHFDIARPSVSEHLRVLKDAGLVIDRRAGTRRIYRVDPQGIAAMRAELDRFWAQALANFKDIVEEPAEEAP